ncbi:TPA: hypothetical protein ACGOW3_002188 [Streptococcus suis]
MDQAEQTAKQLDEIHKLASRHITSKIDQIFESYRRDRGLTEDEAARVLANVKDLSDIRELKLALQNTTDSEEIRQLLILLNSAPYASRIERYEALQREVDIYPPDCIKPKMRPLEPSMMNSFQMLTTILFLICNSSLVWHLLLTGLTQRKSELSSKRHGWGQITPKGFGAILKP